MTNALSVRLRDGFRLVKRLSGAFLRGVLDRIGRRAVIDLDAAPFVPKGWRVEEHKKGGQFRFATSKIGLYLAGGQGSGAIGGHDLGEDVVHQPVLNANALDFLLRWENQCLIPEGWKVKDVFFWGTIYRRGGGFLCVRYLYWDGGRWNWYYRRLDGQWYRDFPAAVPESSA